MSRLFDLTGKVAIVTGSSRGIGLAIAAALAEQGAKVVISSRKQDACDEVAHAINADHGAGTAIAIAASISDKAALQNLVDQTRAQFGRIDILVCNAASNPYYGPMAGITDEQFHAAQPAAPRSDTASTRTHQGRTSRRRNRATMSCSRSHHPSVKNGSRPRVRERENVLSTLGR